MGAILILALMLAIAWFEGPPLIRFGHKREAIIFFILWGVALVYSVAVALGWSVPNPMDWIDFVFGFLTPIR